MEEPLDGNSANVIKPAVVFEVSFSSVTDRGPSVILDNFLYLGSGRDANNVEFITQEGITHVLCMVSGWVPRVAYSDISVNFLHLPVRDAATSQISIHFPQAIEFIDSARLAKAKILVHCAAGISRSSSIVIAYLMKSHNMTLKEAYSFVYTKRTIIRPNTGFFNQLMELENQLYSKCTLSHKDLPFFTRDRPARAIVPQMTLSIEEGMAWAKTVITEELLSAVYLEVCGGTFQLDKMTDFLDKIIQIARNLPAVKEMQAAGYKWPKLSLNMMKTAAGWYKDKKHGSLEGNGDVKEVEGSQEKENGEKETNKKEEQDGETRTGQVGCINKIAIGTP